MKRFVALVACFFCLCACNLTRQAATPAPTSALLFATPATVALSPSDWEAIAPGVEQRTLAVKPPLTLTPFEMVVIRLDPALVQFRAHYEPRQAATLPEWAEALAGALVIVNANFFTETYTAVGLVVMDGTANGQSLEGFGGMLQVDFNQNVRVRSLVQEPYRDEDFLQAVQGFPMLIQPGGELARTGDGFDTPARRTMLAQDTQGRILIMITPNGSLTLRNAQRWLRDADLGIEVAFGLDGGKSTGLFIERGARDKIYASIEPVPVVLAVYPR